MPETAEGTQIHGRAEQMREFDRRGGRCICMGVVTLLNDRAANWLRTQAQAAAMAVCHRPIAWLRNRRNVFREIR